MMMIRFEIRIVYSSGEVHETIRHTKEGLSKGIDETLDAYNVVEWNVKRVAYNVGS
jgi:hypothetical protein